MSAGSTPQPLPLSSFAGVGVEEIGPALLLPDGKLFAIGATGHYGIIRAAGHGNADGNLVTRP